MATFSSMFAGNPFVQAGNMNASDPWGSYNSAYSAAASTNQNLYQQAMAGYAQMIAQANAAQQANNRGWINLQRQTVQGLKGSNRANLQSIADRFAAMSGQMSQQMIDRGLGNSTVQQSLQRGITLDHAKAVTDSENSFAKLIADTRGRIGSARLGAQQQGIGMMSGLQSDQMHYLASIQAPYPDPGMYAQMAAGMSGGGGLLGMPMAGPAPALGPTGGYGPRWGGGAPLDFMGGVGGGGGFGNWAMGGAPQTIQGTTSDFGWMTSPSGYDAYAGGNTGGMGDVA